MFNSKASILTSTLSLFFMWLFLLCSSDIQAQITDTIVLKEIHENARALAKERKFEESNILYEKLSVGYRLIENWTEFFRAEVDISYGLLDLSKYKESENRIKLAILFYDKMVDKQGLDMSYANMHLALGNIYFDQKEHAKGIEHFDIVRSTCERNLDDKIFRKVLSFAYNNLGIGYNHLRKFNLGLSTLKKAYELKLEILGKSDQSTLNTLRNIGDSYHSLGFHDVAIEYYQEVLDIEAEEGEINGMTHSYHDLSKVFQHKRDFVKSREYALKALELNKLHYGEKHDQVAKMLHQIGNAYETERKHEVSIEWYQRSIDMRLEIYGHHIHNSALSLMNIAKAYNFLGDSELSIEKYKEVWAVFEEVLSPEHMRYSELWLSMGNAYLDLGNKAEATRLFELSYERVYKYGSEKSYDRAISCLNLASVLNDYDRAIDICQQGIWEQSVNWAYDDQLDLPQLEHLPNGYWSLRLLDVKSDVWYKKYELSKDPIYLQYAMETLVRASELIDDSREKIFNLGAKTAMANEGREIYEKGVHISYLLDSIHENESYLSDAFFFIERSRSLVLLESVMDHENGVTYIPDSINFRRQTISGSITELELELDHHILEEESLATINAEIFAQKEKIEELDKFIQSNYPQVFQLKENTEIITPSAVQNSLSDDELFVEYLVAEEHIYALKISKSEIELHSLPTDVKMDIRSLIDMTKNVQNAVNQGNSARLYSNFVRLSKNVFDGILAPVLNGPYNSINIVPDGVLSFLPFELLIKETPLTSNKVDYSELDYLIKDREVSYSFSANLFMRENRKYDFEVDEILAFAPDYLESSNEILASRSGFTKLEHINSEASKVVNLIGGLLLNKEEATERNFKNLAPNYRFLHLAMHAFTDEEKPLKSGLIFSDIDDEEEDNVLHNYELYNMNLPAEMVVLSACNTGSGRIEKGEGVMSLARGFRQAGVPNIVMSLWQADDESTSIIMQRFYELLKEGKEKDAALREAKLNYLSLNRKSFPYFWSAFVLMGDDVAIKSSNKNKTIAIAIGLAFLLGIGYWGFKRAA